MTVKAIKPALLALQANEGAKRHGIDRDDRHCCDDANEQDGEDALGDAET